MMKYFIVILIASALAFAAQDTCYSVQVNSFFIKDRGSYTFKGYPESCHLIEINGMYSARCGCFKEYAKALSHQKTLEQKYPDSMIAETYTYRFSKDVKQSVTDENDQELRLLFQVFSYSSDMDNACLTAKKALKISPRSLYWHKKMSEVAMWTGRTQEAVEHMMYIYKRTRDKKLEDKIYEYSLSAYQYETAAVIIEKKVKKDPSKKNIEEMAYIFDLVGKPLESAEVLDELYQKDQSRSYLLTQQLQIYLNMGEMQRAKKVVKKIEKKKMRDIESAFLCSQYYFIVRDMDASYTSLQSVDLENADGNLTQYYMQLSDLAWYKREHEQAAQASIKVDEVNATRLVDYERILAVYKDTDHSRAMKAALGAYEKFSQNYLFYTYAYMAMDMKQYQEVLEVCEKIETKSNNTLVQDALYWMIKAQLYTSVNDDMQAKQAFDRAQALSPDSNEVLEPYLWFLMDTKDTQALSNLLFSLEEKEKVSPSLWLPMAVAYFSIQDGDRASYYLDRLKKNKMQSRESDLLYAYVKQSQNDENAFYKEIGSIYKKMKKVLQDRPEKGIDSDFMQSYLSVKMFFVGADEFEESLQSAKPVLKHDAYKALSLSFAQRENIDEQVKMMAEPMKASEPWIRLNLSLSSNDKQSQHDIIYKYYRILPVGDILTAATDNNQIAFAQSIAFEGLEKNEKNSLLYEQMRNLHNEHADSFVLKAGYLSRSGLDQTYSDMHNSYYLAKGYSFETDLFLASNSIKDDAIFKSIPSSSTSFGLGIKKRFERGSYQVDIGLRDSADTYNYFSFKYKSIISRRLNIELTVDKAAEAQESVYLMVGGYKDRIGLQTTYSILGSSTIGLYLEEAKYSSDDGVSLGSGLSGRLDYSYLQRSAYPDITFTPYYSFGLYDEKSGSKGVIDNMLTFADGNVISDDFWYAGVDLSYGMENRYNYVRVWRPFFSVSPYYNGRESQFNYGFSAGLGGELFGQDNLSLVAEYSESIGGTTGQLWRTYFRYKILY